MKGASMKKAVIVCGVIILAAGCYQQHDPNVKLQTNVRSDSLDNNIITRPIGGIVSFLIGQNIKVENVKEVRTPEGFLQVQVSGRNESAFKKVFEYRTEWLDANGMIIDSIMSKWMTVSVPGNSEFSFKVISPSPKADNYRINTRTAKNMDK
jgi:uncharacterized protein YcfL